MGKATPLWGLAVGAVVTVSNDAVPATVVIVPLVPVMLPVVAVTVPATPAVAETVSVSVATPDAFVAELARASVPLVAVQFTVWPEVATALPLTSRNCAVTTTFDPATGLLAAVTAYCVGTSGPGVMTLLVPVNDPVVAVTVCCVAVGFVVNVTVAMPLEFVVDVAEPNEPPPLLDHVTTCPAVNTALLLPSDSCALIVTAWPATGVVLFAVTRYFVAEPPVNATSALLEIAVALAVPVIVALPLAVADVSVAV